MSKTHIIDRVLHWLSAILLLYMMMNMGTLIHTVDWTVKGQVEHRQEAIQDHAVMGTVLLILLIARIAWYYSNKDKIPRTVISNKKHQLFISATHWVLYLTCFALVATGFYMVANIDIPLQIFGIEFTANMDNYWQNFPAAHDIHMTLRDALWWLIALHFAGVMYSKK